MRIVLDTNRLSDLFKIRNEALLARELEATAVGQVYYLRPNGIRPLAQASHLPSSTNPTER
jgi:hypothetical protein